MVFRIFRLTQSNCGEYDLQNIEPGTENLRRINLTVRGTNYLVCHTEISPILPCERIDTYLYSFLFLFKVLENNFLLLVLDFYP